jgi:spore germination protein
MKFYTDIDQNIKHMEDTFQNCGDIIKRKVTLNDPAKTAVYIIFADSMADRFVLEISIANRLQNMDFSTTLKPFMYDKIKEDAFATPEVQEETEIDSFLTFVMSGDVGIIIDGSSTAIIIAARGFPNRGVQTAETEATVQGSREAFTEVIRFNTVLIRRRLRDTQLRVKNMRVGRRSQTDIALMYIEDIARPEIVTEVNNRIESIDIDAVMDCGTIEQLIEDSPFSPFPQILLTERPDKAAAAILEGRIAVVVDNSPFVMVIPSVFNSFFSSPEDYYQRFEIMSFTRALRFIATFLAVALPGFYVAMVLFHPEMIPSMLAFKIAGSQVMIPFPTVVEIVMMELAFELLREAGLRLPGPIGGAIGIIGGLIVGQAAIEAGIVSPMVLIVMALTGITSFAIPSYQLINGYRLVKFLIIALAATLGLLGFWLAVLIIVIHLAGLSSFGIPYLYPFAAGGLNDYEDSKDTFLRPPTHTMKNRPIYAQKKQSHRMT